MIQILDFLINALVSWRTRIVLARQKADMCCLDGKENPADAGFFTMNAGGIDEPVFSVTAGRGSGHSADGFSLNTGVGSMTAQNPAPVYFPGFTEAELKAMVNQNKGQNG